MPRNGAGIFNLAQPAFQSQTPISSGAMNSDLSDIADGLTGSLPRDGQGAMTAVLPLASTGFTYSADPNTGMSRSAADEQVITCGGTVIARFSSTGVDFTGSVNNDGNAVDPPGVIKSYAGTVIPAGYLTCDGTAVSRTTYARLFAAIGTTYGSGDGSTTFNLPDLRGRAIAAVDAGSGRLPGYTTLGTAGGLASQAVAQNQLPNVTIAANVNGSVSVNSLATNVVQGTIAGPIGLNLGVSNFLLFNIGQAAAGQIFSSGFNSLNGFTASINGGVTQAALNVTQPTMALYLIIKT